MTFFFPSLGKPIKSKHFSPHFLWTTQTMHAATPTKSGAGKLNHLVDRRENSHCDAINLVGSNQDPKTHAQRFRFRSIPINFYV